MTLMSYDCYDAIDHAEMLEEGPAKRNFIETGEITPEIRASVELHKQNTVAFDELAEYIDRRVAAGTTAAPICWPK